jgi:hypothetical protein
MEHAVTCVAVYSDDCSLWLLAAILLRLIQGHVVKHKRAVRWRYRVEF